jgi:hypothetical protein
MRLGHAWTSRIDQRIAELERLKLALTECIGCGCLSLERSRLCNPDDWAARLGPRSALLGRRPTTRLSLAPSWSEKGHDGPIGGLPMAVPL